MDEGQGQTAPVETAAAPVEGGSAPEAGAPSSGGDSEPLTPWTVPEGVVRIKAAGGEHEFKTLEELTKAATMGIGARKAFSELDELRKARESWDGEKVRISQQLNAWIENIKKNPAALLEEIGVDPTQFSERHLRQHVDYQAMTPEQRAEKAAFEQAQRELLELRQYKQERETEKQKAEREAEEAKIEATNKADEEALRAEITKELEADPVLGVETVRPKAINRVASIIVEAHAAGIYCPTDKAIAYYRAERMEELDNHVKGLPPEQAIKRFGEEWAKGIREFEIQRAKGPNPPKPATKGEEQPRYNSIREMIQAQQGKKS